MPFLIPFAVSTNTVPFTNVIVTFSICFVSTIFVRGLSSKPTPMFSTLYTGVVFCDSPKSVPVVL